MCTFTDWTYLLNSTFYGGLIGIWGMCSAGVCWFVRVSLSHPIILSIYFFPPSRTNGANQDAFIHLHINCESREKSKMKYKRGITVIGQTDIDRHQHKDELIEKDIKIIYNKKETEISLWREGARWEWILKFQTLICQFM